jgi:putative endonuclease
MNITKQDTGQLAEQLAANYLRQHGFTIRHVNWRWKHKELDIIAEKDGRLHVVEVRSLHSAYFQAPYQSIDRQKQRHLIAATDAYIKQYKLTMEVQLDVVSIVFNGATHTLEYLPNAIYPTA